MDKQYYFLGANSNLGFYSCYEHFCVPEEGNFLWVIKGGPGCGKSSFMRKIGKAAEDAGHSVEYVLCSGDPDSLDGVYIQELKVGYVDGTAPHILEVPYPAVRGSYLDLGKFYDMNALAEKTDAVIRVNKAYKEEYQKAYRCLQAYLSPAHMTKIKGRKTRFESAVSCRGVVTLDVLQQAQHLDRDTISRLIRENDDAVVYLHPLWPQLVRGMELNGELYTTDAEVPSCDEAVSHLRTAKALHDELEGIYNPHVDFAGIYGLAEKHIKKLF